MTRKIESSFRGYFDELPGIFADNFENAQNQKARAYFLSHYHGDHIQGLHSPELLKVLMETNVKIFTTELTAAIINHNTLEVRLMDYVKVLDMGTSSLILPSIPNRNISELYLTVTLIPAGHSAGSTMFVFKTKTKTILFTGDFRMNSNDLQKYKYFHENSEPITLDALYVDTTFINMVNDYPKRSESTQIVVREISKWLSDDLNAVAIHTSAMYGYEFVFNEIYKALGVKIHVDDLKWSLYSKIPHLVPGVTNQDTRVHLCSKRSEKSPHDDCIQTKYKKYLYIHLSAYKWGKSRVISSVERVTSTRIDVCFATHCSRRELKYFVEYFSPKKIYGFPNPYQDEDLEECPVPIKKSKADKKVDKKVLNLILG